jgi:hypothetical protein
MKKKRKIIFLEVIKVKMDMPLVCESCHKEFKSKYNLKNHIEKSKKCIKERGLEVTSDYVCKACNHITAQNIETRPHY